jgi:hypothetical protein
MKTMGVLVASTLFAVLIANPVQAQQPAPPHGMAQPPAAMAPAPPSGPDGMKGPAMPMMDMCRDVMGGMAGPAMMGPSGPMGPKERAAMLEMRGEMMKAMGDVMMKHARRMQGTTDK